MSKTITHDLPTMSNGALTQQSSLEKEAIHAHIERYLGAIHQAFGDLDSPASGIEVLHVAPVVTRPVHTLITSGMSAQAMQVPEDVDAPRFLELMITLPEYWKLDAQSASREEWSWPLRLLQSFARRPHETNSWVGWGQAIPNGEPPRPYASTTKLCGALAVPSLLVPTDFYELMTEHKRIAFYAVVPLYREELELSRTSGTQTLLERIVDRDLNDVVDPKRKNAAKKRFGLF